MTEASAGGRANPWVALGVLSLGLFMTLLDTTIVNVAIPQLIDSLDASLDEALWINNAYVLVFGVALITAGRLGDIYGPRNLFIAGISLFTAASGACAVATSPEMLIAARAAQGLGAALLTPQSLAIVMPLFPAGKRGRAFALNSVTAGIAAAAGPTIGGLIIAQWDWRGIFVVNLPVGIIALVLTFWLVPDVRAGKRHRLDLSGVLVVSLALFAITFALTEGQRYSWGEIAGVVTIPMLLVAGIALLVAFVWMQRRRQTGDREPLVPFAIFADRNFTLMNLTAAAIQLSLAAVYLPMMIYLQSVLDLSALEAGLVFMPSAVLGMLCSPIAGRTVDRIGGKYVLIVGLVAFAVGLAQVAATAGVGTSPWALMPGLLLMGAALGGIFAPLYTLAMARVDSELVGAAAGVLNTTRQLGGALGGAAVGALLQIQLASQLHDEAAARADQLPAGLRGPFVDSFADASHGGLEVGAGQSGGSLPIGPDTPERIARKVVALGGEVFDHAFVSALHLSLLLPVIVVALTAIACFKVRQGGAHLPPEELELVSSATSELVSVARRAPG